MTNAPEGGLARRRARLIAGAGSFISDAPPRQAQRIACDASRVPPPMQPPQDHRPDNREVEEEQHKARPSSEGPPRPSTEPSGSESSVKKAPTATDPGTGEQKT